MKSLILIATLVGFSALSQEIEHVFAPNWQNMNLKGNVKSMTEIVNKKSIQIQETSLSTFDSLGRLKEVRILDDTLSAIRNLYIYNDSLLVESKTRNYHSKFKYNEFGQVSISYNTQISFQILRFTQNNNTIDSCLSCDYDTIFYIYNDKSQLIKKVTFDSEQSFGDFSTYKYNKLGKLILETDFSIFQNGKSLKEEEYFRTEYVYNSNRQLKRIKYFDEKKLYIVCDIKYDDAQNVVEEVFNELDNVKTVLIFKDNLIKDEFLYFEKSENTHIRYEYEFDKLGNWTQKTAIHDNGNVDVITRIFEYYTNN